MSGAFGRGKIKLSVLVGIPVALFFIYVRHDVCLKELC